MCWKAATVFVLVAVSCGARVSPAQQASISSTGALTPTSAAAPARSAMSVAGGITTSEQTPSGDGGAEHAASVVHVASDVGVTPDTIVLGHVTQLTGPVPGIFKGSVVGLRAFIAYQNSVGGIAGRELVPEIRDDQLDATQNRELTRELIGKAFALIGGISLYDDASAEEVEQAGIPDISTPVSAGRAAIPNNFAPTPALPAGAPLGPWIWLREHYPDDVTAMASLYADIPSAKHIHENYRDAAESLGFKWVYERGYQPTESDYTADVVRMRQSGVKGLFLYAVDVKTISRILSAAMQQNWKPDVVFLGAGAYDRALPTLAREAAEGVKLFLPYSLYAGEDDSLAEVALMDQWVQRVNPGFVPDVYAAGAWMAGRMFAQAMAAVGENPTRKQLLVALKRIEHFDANGMEADVGPASKRPPTCFLYAEVHDGAFRRVDPVSGFRCDGGLWQRS